jgi:hypothetical protein
MGASESMTLFGLSLVIIKLIVRRGRTRSGVNLSLILKVWSLRWFGSDFEKRNQLGTIEGVVTTIFWHCSTPDCTIGIRSQP